MHTQPQYVNICVHMQSIALLHVESDQSKHAFVLMPWSVCMFHVHMEHNVSHMHDHL